jgi:hypothetical protein
MHWARDAFGSALTALLIVGLMVALLADSPVPPSEEQCVALWNAPQNARLQALVTTSRYWFLDVAGVFSEGRYEGCGATFFGGQGEPWAMFSAVRVPRQERPLRWVLDLRGQSWGFDDPLGEPRPTPNAIVLPDGRIVYGTARVAGSLR